MKLQDASKILGLIRNSSIWELLERLKTHRYRARKIRRKYIPKDSGKLRPLGIPTLEDKIVQMSARRFALDLSGAQQPKPEEKLQLERVMCPEKSGHVILLSRGS